MKHLCLAALTLPLLSACAGNSSAGNGTSTVAALETAYLAAAATAMAYEALPGANPSVVTAIKRDENAVFAALQPLVTAAQAGNSLDSIALATAQAAMAVLQADLPATAATAAAGTSAAAASAATPAQGGAK